MLGQIRESKFETLAAEPVAWLRNHSENRILRRFPQNARRLAILVAIDAARPADRGWPA